VVEFYFTHSKLTEQAFCAKNVIGKYTVSKSMGVLGFPAHLPTPMLNNISAVVFINRKQAKFVGNHVKLINCKQCFTDKHK